MSTEKAVVTARELTDLLTKRISTAFPFVAQSLDVNENPVVTFSALATPAAGSKVAVIRIRPLPVTALDAFGNKSQAMCPHIVDLITEANSATATDTTVQAGADVLTPIADILTPADLLPILAEIARRSMEIDWFVTANGTVPSIVNIPATPAATFKPNLYWGNLSSQ